jgi:hypothetical protein
MAIQVNTKALTPQQLQDYQDLETRLLRMGKNADVFADAINKANGNATIIARELKAMEGFVNGLTNATNQFNVSLNDSLDLAKAIVDELKKQEGPIVRAKKAMSGLVSIGQQLVDEEREFDAISEKRLKDLAREASVKLKNFQIEAKNIAGNKTIQDKILDNENKLYKISQLTSQTQIRASKKLKEKLQDELNILNGYEQQDKAYRAIQQHAEKRYKLEQATTKTFGLTGVALSAASNIASRFGMSHVQEQLDDINNKLREDMRKEIEANSGQALNFGRRFAYAGKAVFELTKTLAKGMLDPLFIMGKIFNAFLDVNKAAVDYTRLSGINATNQAALNSRIATSVDYLKVAAELTNQLGMSATSVFSNDDIAAMAEAKNLLGLSAEQAGSLGIQSKLANQSIDGFQDSLLEGASAGNQLNNSLVAPGVALQDVLNASEDITMSLGNNPEKLGKAAVAARAFGLDLAKVNEIASSLLQFEDSIGNELEAELMIGKQLNLEKAREYALTNDLEGLSKELAKNGATAAEFSKMNRLQQESLAKALGMSREQLGKSILAQEASKNATLEQRAAVMGVTKEQMQSMDIQERMTKMLDKLAQAFAPIFEALVPIVTIIGNAIAPIAHLVGSLAAGLGPFIGYLVTGYGILKGMQVTLTAISGLQAFITASKASELGLGGSILMQMGFMRAIAAYRFAQETQMTGLKAVQLVMEETILGSIIAQGAGILRNIARLGVQLVVSLANAAAALTTNAALTFGIGVAIAVGAALAGYAAIKSMKDGVIDPGKGPIMTGGFGSVQLDPRDKAMYGADGKIKVGTNLNPDADQAISQTRTQTIRPQTITQAAAKSDNTSNEIRQMREENKSLLSALLNKTGDVYMDSNKVGKSQVVGSYKSS